MGQFILDDLFTGGRQASATGRPQSARPVQQPVKKQQSNSKPNPSTKTPPTRPLQEGEGSDVCAVAHPIEPDAYAFSAEEKDVLLKNVERACNGNRYLEGMVLGEILNSPRFKGGYRR